MLPRQSDATLCQCNDSGGEPYISDNGEEQFCGPMYGHLEFWQSGGYYQVKVKAVCVVKINIWLFQMDIIYEMLSRMAWRWK